MTMISGRPSPKTRRHGALMLAGAALALMAGCTEPLDFDMRGHLGAFNTSEAARNATMSRPRPDNRGIISYPNYQVAVARDGDTVAKIAARVGTSGEALARYNGLQTGDTLRDGEIIALPSRVAEPSPATGAMGTGPIRPASTVDVASVAGRALDEASASDVQTSTLAPAPTAAPAPSASASRTPAAQTGEEPIRHKVQRGETAFTVSRLYKVSVRSLAEWNGLDENFTIREGQYLLIPPVGAQTAPVSAVQTEAPGVGSPTPVPPSSAEPLPAEKTVPQAEARAQANQVAAAPDLSGGQSVTTPRAGSEMVYPVKGSIIRTYTKGKTDGIDIAAQPGSAVVAAKTGSVAAITSDSDNVHVIVLRHADGLLTIYSNVTGIAVKEGQQVSQGAKIAEIRPGASPYVHFEVRRGMNSTDPMPFLE